MYDLRLSRRWLWRMVSSGMLRCLALVRIDVSEELSASFIRVTKIGELEQHYVRFEVFTRWLWRMVSSAMLSRVALVRTDVSEELRASIIRVKGTGSYKSSTASHPRRHHSSPSIRYCRNNNERTAVMWQEDLICGPITGPSASL
jgi:hypothetical protein